MNEALLVTPAKQTLLLLLVEMYTVVALHIYELDTKGSALGLSFMNN